MISCNIELSEDAIEKIRTKMEKSKEKTRKFIRSNYPETEWEYKIKLSEKYETLEIWITVCVERYLQDNG